MFSAANFIAACVQVNAGTDVALNLESAAALARQARAQGAELIAFPENVSLMLKRSDAIRARAFTETEHPALPFFIKLAVELESWIVIGSLGIRLEDGMLANRSFLIDPSGAVKACYDKIHLFDASLPGGQQYRESATIRPGEQATLGETPWGALGMTICYDVRFAPLYLALAQAGARFIAIPAAFTVLTGQDHWCTLVRARAIETGCYILAPAQCGIHDGARATYGHSMLVDPWGKVLAEAGDKPAVITATFVPDLVERARSSIPAIFNHRSFRRPKSIAHSAATGCKELAESKAISSLSPTENAFSGK